MKATQWIHRTNQSAHNSHSKVAEVLWSVHGRDRIAHEFIADAACGGFLPFPIEYVSDSKGSSHTCGEVFR